MKNYLTIIAIFITNGWVAAQDFSKSISSNRVEIRADNSRIDIEGYEGSELKIFGVDIDKPPKRADGLKALYNTGEDNTGIGLFVVESNGTLKIEKVSRRDGDYVIKVPRNVHLLVEETSWNGDGFKIINLAGEVEIYAKGSDIEIRNVSGPIIAETTNGDILGILTELSQKRQSLLKSVNGYVDITLPAATAADLNLKSTNGEIYTDFDLDKDGYSSSKWKSWRSHSFRGKANGGGPILQLASINDDVFLRTQK